MRKFIVFLILLMIAALAYLAYAHFSGGAIPTFGLPLGGEKAKIRERTKIFFENLKFKNINALRDFVSQDSSPEQFSHYLKENLGLDLEKIDLEKVEVENIELDSLQQRARVKIKLEGRELVTKKPFAYERIVFLFRGQDDKWLFDVNSTSL